MTKKRKKGNLPSQTNMLRMASYAILLLKQVFTNRFRIFDPNLIGFKVKNHQFFVATTTTPAPTTTTTGEATTSIDGKNWVVMILNICYMFGTDNY